MGTNSGSPPTATDVALSEAQRAIDNAVRTMFELAYRLELLREAIERADTDPPPDPTMAQVSHYS